MTTPKFTLNLLPKEVSDKVPDLLGITRERVKQLKDITIAAFYRVREEQGDRAGLVDAFKYTVEGCDNLEEVVLTIFVIGQAFAQAQEPDIFSLMTKMLGRSKPE